MKAALFPACETVREVVVSMLEGMDISIDQMMELNARTYDELMRLASEQAHVAS